MGANDDAIVAAAEALQRLKGQLGAAYWQDPRVKELQENLRRLIGRHGAWGEDRPPMHQRARQAARFEQTYARLLWPGGGDE